MPAKAVKSPLNDAETIALRAQGITVPYFPDEMNDRSEGWGTFGRLDGYPQVRDDGVWPPSEINEPSTLEAPETSHGDWYRNGILIS